MECPNCGAHIGRFELDQNCKNCGINLFYSQQETLLSRDAKNCELEYASMRIFVSKLRAAFIGGALPIARIVLTLLCVGALFVPFATLKTELPLFSHTFSFGGYGIYQGVTDGTLKAILNMSEGAPAYTKSSVILLGIMAVILLSAVVMFLCEILSFINIRKSAKAMAVLSVIGLVFSLASGVISIHLVNLASESSPEFITAEFGFGWILSAVMFTIMLIINILFIKKDVKAVIKEVDLDRVAMRKRVKAGEVSLDDLPLPVFESAEEKGARLEREKKSAELEAEAKSKAKGGEHVG